jgi:RNA polymerase sigma-B factor
VEAPVTAAGILTSVPAARVHGYEYLSPLFFQRDGLPVEHPERARLRDRLISGYRPVAQHIARRYGYRNESADDLEQVATLGLILAVDRFDVNRGVDFLSFAVPTITGEVLRHLRDRSTPIRVPRRLRELQAAIYDAAAELGQRLRRSPRPSEIAAELQVDLEVVLECLASRAAGHCSSLDEPAEDDEGRSGDRVRLGAALKCTDPSFELIDQREALIPLLAALPERDRTILALRFFEGMTQTEIGARVGISQMHVSRLLSRTLTSLRTKLAAD